MIKLPDFTTCLEAKIIFQKMGIERIYPLPEVEFIRTRVESREIQVPNPERLQFGEQLRIGAVDLRAGAFSISTDKLIELNGFKCAIYIKNQSQGVNTHNKTSDYRYHLCECGTITNMIEQGRKDRYVAASSDDGQFPVNVQNYYASAREMRLRLELCQNCKNILQQKGVFFEPFSLKEYFKKNNSVINNSFKRTEQVVITEKYAPNHNEVAKKYKEAVNYVCQSCDVNCIKYPGCLHLHHKNGNGADNDRHNLMVLCVCCHITQPAHNHMRNNRQFEAQIQIVNQLRKEQGVYTINVKSQGSDLQS